MHCKKKYLKIGTYNVRGYNAESKQRLTFEEYRDLDIDIMGITETKICKTNSKYILNNDKTYKS